MARFLGQHARAARTRRPRIGARKSRSDCVADRAHGQDHESVEAVRWAGAAAQCACTGCACFEQRARVVAKAPARCGCRNRVAGPADGALTPFDIGGSSTHMNEQLVAHCDELRLEQVLINLLGNALDATSGVTSPRIVIDIEAAESTLSIAVRDNGPGIPDDVLPRLFEPFFTTKEMGQGLGLGLAISSSIARDCGGSLVARNAPDGGAQFVLTLRRARALATDPLVAGS
ncbi:sensor histidine kinase [Paraburkholderia megapolitana]|uniref:sensor histidine kinase n=1 Tax=Paraburkholderia megapolitana TaxID=420953 RepID=UPI003908A704